jgi:alpha-L-fucosidase 2
LRAAVHSQPIILNPADFAHHVERFNALEDEPVVNLVPNAKSWEWIVAYAPLFDCPDKKFEEIYYYRWWTLRKHIKDTPHGRVLTEFITPVGHAGPHNTISCALGHHIAEGRWLRDRTLLDEYIRFWFRSGPDGGRAEHFHQFSSWAPAAIYDRYLVTGDRDFAVDLLDDLVADYKAWEAERGRPDGLFWQFDVRDGMEESISGSRTAKHIRPTINSYMAANARAIAKIAELAGRDDVARTYTEKFETLRTRMLTALWDPAARFFKVRRERDGLSDAREAIGFIPWTFDLAESRHAVAWQQIKDPAGFLAPRGLATAEQRHPDFRSHGTGTCEWDGAVWPFATSQTLGGFGNVLRGPPQPFVSRRDYFDQLLTYARAHQNDGRPYIGEYHDESTGEWLITGPKAERSRYYNHSTFCDLVVSGLVGLVPRADDVVEINPLLPDDVWDWFCLDGVPYRGRSLTIAWDREGHHYGRGAGLAVWADGKELARSPSLRQLSVRMPLRAADRTVPLVLWYDKPANAWTEALPIGNGRLGAMVFGGIEQEKLQFNEDSLWTGKPHSYAHEGAAKYLPELRRLLLAGMQREAEQLAMKHFMSVPLRQTAYQPFGDVEIEFPHGGSVTEYRRSLDLDTAIATTSYRVNGVLYTRQSFASHPDRVIVVRLSCQRPGRLAFTVRLTTPHKSSEVVSADDNSLLLSGRVTNGATKFASHLRIMDTDGNTAIGADTLSVSDATSATLVLTAATSVVNFRDVSADPVERSRGDLERIAGKSFDELRAAHIRDHQALFRRVSLRLGAPHEAGAANYRTDERVLRSKRSRDPALAALLFQYGRYLMIASSRPGAQPANLQGLWNDQLDPPWESKYTVNINAEMNYWPTEPCNLSECGAPLFDAIGELAESGRETARAHYAARGWVLHHNFDIWRGTAPINASDHGIWPTGGAWLCQHLWWHYLYTGDEEFLRKTAYPIMKAAAEFCADYLFEDPRSANDKSRMTNHDSDIRHSSFVIRPWLISGPSNSPEQGGLVLGPTMDHQIIRDLFANTIAASAVLGVDESFRGELAGLRARIAPNQIGRHGQLQEWLEDKDDPANRHRHVSHLWGLFPGEEITVDTPELLAAARRSLEMRGDGGTGWSLAWKINLWARLGDGNRAHRMLANLLTLTGSAETDYQGGGVYPNLFDAHPPFQIDGNFGATSGICEMLLQSHRLADDGTRLVELLPALPAAWAEGEVTGLRAREGFEIDIRWRRGKLVECTIRSHLGRPVTVASGDRRKRLELGVGDTVQLNGELDVATND